MATFGFILGAFMKYVSKMMIAFSVLLSACATENKKDTPMPVAMQKGLQEVQAKGVVPAASQPEPIVISPITVSQELTWTNFELMVIELDKNKKPRKSEKIQLEDKKTSSFNKSGPQINVSSYSLNSDTGKVVQLSCPGFDLKQKFSSATLLKGWAVEFNCNKNDYFVIINQK